MKVAAIVECQLRAKHCVGRFTSFIQHSDLVSTMWLAPTLELGIDPS